MLSIKRGFSLVVSFLFAVSGFASTPFTAIEFEKAKSDEKVIVLDFHASWCSTCKKQSSVVEDVLKEKAFEGIVAFQVDYDSEAQLKKELGVSHQSALILFKGKNEIARGMAITSVDDVRKFLGKARKELAAKE